MALGSLVTPVFYIFRVILELIYGVLRKWDNKLTRRILSCIRCLSCCNKNAYIMCAIHGKPFCASARDAHNLLMRTFSRAVALNKVTDFLFFLTKIMISLEMGIVAYISIEHKLNYNAVPVVAVMLGTYLIANVFFKVHSMAVDTLFLCFCTYFTYVSWII